MSFKKLYLREEGFASQPGENCELLYLDGRDIIFYKFDTAVLQTPVLRFDASETQSQVGLGYNKDQVPKHWHFWRNFPFLGVCAEQGIFFLRSFTATPSARGSEAAQRMGE